MKTTIQILNKALRTAGAITASAILLITLAFTSCTNNSAQEDTKEIANDQNDAKFENPKQTDAEFLVNAAEINLEEIQLGQLAQSNGMMSEVKELGKMMQAEHSKSLTDLQALAASKQITIPTSLTNEGQDANKKLSDEKGKDFDKEYCNMMVKGHKDAIDIFEKQSTEGTDAEIKSWATGMLPALRSHLDHSLTCQKACEKM
ncbi:MAG: DUF4142 domain-containing protein [Chitinophagales bacterium]|nr:DUF4142 domain-containing protein [Chitinophagales bacterium]